MASQFLIDFENQLGLNSARAATVLGIAYATYAGYRNQTRELPVYHVDKVILLCNCGCGCQKQFLDWKLNGN
jgi:hypothetical protein